MLKVMFNKPFFLDFPPSLVKFGDLPFDELCEAYQDGRVSSHLIERLLARHYFFTNNKGKGKDHLAHDGIKYESKVVTKNGCDISPSFMQGTGRELAEVEFLELAAATNYIITDVSHFPIVEVVFKRGLDILKLSKDSAKLSYKKSRELFAEVKNNE